MEQIIIYDFDGTLTPHPITKFEVLDKCGLVGGIESLVLLKMIYDKINNEGMEQYEAIYTSFLEIIKKSGLELTDENLSLGAERLEYNKGAVAFMKKMHECGVKNYLLSSGVKVLLEKTIVYNYFDSVYATTFKYDSDNEIVGIDYLMSDKKKVDIIKKILVDNGKREDDCSNVIYVGDGLTDLYAMEYVKKHGGKSVFVYLNENSETLDKARNSDVVSNFFLADYSENSDLYNYFNNLC